MTELRIVTPEEARERMARSGNPRPTNAAGSLLYTVATEPDRTRAAVVKVLRRLAPGYTRAHMGVPGLWEVADAIENGANYE